MRRGLNSFHLQLQSKDCLNITADPQLVVQEGYVLAFYASLIYIKFFDDPTNGYLYKSVAFPSSISKGVLIKTTNPYAPKIEAYIEPISPSTPSSSTTISSGQSVTNNTTTALTSETSFITVSSSSIPPSPISGIPPPDLSPDECLFGINEAFVQSFKEKTITFLNLNLPSLCNGIIERWEFCYKHINKSSVIQIGVWRQLTNDTDFIHLGSNDISVLPKDVHYSDPLVCSVVTSSSELQVKEGDVIGFNSSDILMAFSDKNIKRSTDGNEIPLLRAIISKRIIKSRLL